MKNPRLSSERPRAQGALEAAAWSALCTSDQDHAPAPPGAGVAAIGRRSATSCKHQEGLGHQLTLFQVYHNFVLPHASLRQALAEPLPTNGTGSAKVWR